MRTTRYLLALVIAGLMACGTVSEPQPAAPEPAAQSEAPAPEPVAEPTPAPQPEVVEPAPVPVKAVASRPPARKAVKVSRKSAPPAPAPVPVKASVPTEQEIAAALAIVDDTLNRYMLEQVRFTAPATLKQNATGEATLEVLSAGAFDAARQAIAGNEQVRKAGIEVSSRVQSRLVGDNIGVKAVSPETRELSGALPAQWKWQLLPSATGKATLHLVVSVDTMVGGSTAPRAVHSIDKELVVEGAAPAPAAQGFFGANWWWMLIVVVLGLAGVWYAKRKAA